jgi:hypothetical protein
VAKARDLTGQRFASLENAKKARLEAEDEYFAPILEAFDNDTGGADHD